METTAERRETILLVDDRPENLLVLEGVLEGCGYQLIQARSGHDALRAALKQEIDLILMDVQMPEMDGLEATAAIRLDQQASGLHTPIIAMTAHALKGDRERCLEAGMDGYVAKPIRPQELYQALAAAFPPA